LRDYELLYILSLVNGDETIPGLVDKVNGMITRYGGEIADSSQTSPWGKRRLAYPIEKQQEGFYVLSHLKMEPKQVLELDRDMRISEDVLRHLLISLDKH
jgi:small subunit ribosomal protein S6